MAETPSPDPHSGSAPGAAPLSQEDALAVGTRLAEFEILGVLGVGGFGIVYRAKDHALEREVALKEYMPSALAGRRTDGGVLVRSSGNTETFTLGLRSFINEARLLARFDHPSLVKVYRFWEANGTAYMVMPYYRGHTFKQMRAELKAPPDEAWLRQALDALLGALESLHAEGVYHRDVAPDNVLVTDGGRPVLLDFGAARQVIGDATQNLTAILKPNFAPIEQYADATQMRQGPWTDLYALAATTYQLLIGRPPMAAAARMLQDDLPLLADLRPQGHSAELLRVLDWALAVRPEDRPQSAAAMREALLGLAVVPDRKRGPTRAEAPVAAGASPGGPMPADYGAMSTVSLPPQPATYAAAAPKATASARPQPAGAQRSPSMAGAASPDRRASRGRGWMAAGTAAAVVALAGAYGFWPRSASVAAAAQPTAVALAANAMPEASASAAPLVIIEEEAPAQPAAKAPASVASAKAATRPARPAYQAPVFATVPAPAPAPAAAAEPVQAPPAQKTTVAAADDKRLPAVETRVPTPVRKAEIEGDSPRKACGARVFIAFKLCMERECENPRFHSHPQCVRLREHEAQRRETPRRDASAD